MSIRDKSVGLKLEIYSITNKKEKEAEPGKIVIITTLKVFFLDYTRKFLWFAHKRLIA